MTLFTDRYHEKVNRFWDSYVLRKTALPEHVEGFSQIICDSWRRSRDYGIDPLKEEQQGIQEDWGKNLERKRDLISAVSQHIHNLYTLINGSDFLIVLADEYGNIIDLYDRDFAGSDATIERLFAIGCNMNEKLAGTNGIGTCLAAALPVRIWGVEHYKKIYHDYVSSAAPIKDQTGCVIGCLAIIEPKESVNALSFALVCVEVDRIENAMKMQNAIDEISVINKQLNATIQAIKSGVIMVHGDGTITQYNKTAIEILKLPFESLANKNLSELFLNEDCDLDLVAINEDIHKKEISLTNIDGITLNLLISCHVIKKDSQQKRSTVFIFEEMEAIRKMVSKMSGFTAKYTFESIIGNSKAINDVKTLGNIASKSDSNVLLLGESGTGKELVAQAIHNSSSRNNAPFIAINCGSIPKGLIESELFGYEGGAFTGARKDGYPGKFELADGGTIFLDEIGDMPLDLQASLLRVIQTKEIIRIGGSRAKKVDVRIMAATNVNLAMQIRENHFRSDLYYRLNVLSIVIPPLRKRPDDIMLLANRFMHNYNKIIGKNVTGMTAEAEKILIGYEWPGNVRELENAIERAINLTAGDMISVNELPFDILAAGNKNIQSNISNPPKPEAPIMAVQETEYRLIVEALEKNSGNINKVTMDLGMPRRTLYRRLSKYEIDLDKYRNLKS